MRFANIQNQSLFIWLSQSSSVALTNLVLCGTVFFLCSMNIFNSVEYSVDFVLFNSNHVSNCLKKYFTIMRIEYIQYRLYFNFNCHQITRNFLHSKFDTQKKKIIYDFAINWKQICDDCHRRSVEFSFRCMNIQLNPSLHFT